MEALLRMAERLIHERNVLVEQLQNLTFEDLSFKPAPDKWSILMVIEHLVLAESEIIGDLDQVQKSSSQTRCLRDRMAYFITLLVLRFGIPVPVVSHTMEPIGKTPLEALVHQWRENQGKLLTFVKGLNKDTARRAVFSHPFAGALNTRQILRLATFHFDSHVRQIRRNLRLLGHELGRQPFV